MSRGFVKEEDQEEAPFIPPRAALPSGVINYVTPQGYQQLIEERQDLEDSRREVDITSDKEKRHAISVIDGKLNLLNERIASARILKSENQPKEEVRFGATVKFMFLSANRRKSQQEFTIVGVDEADIDQRKIAFLAPLARALTGKKVGERVEVMMAGKNQQLEIQEITYS